MEYLDEWLQHAQFLDDYSWIGLNKVPEWTDIDKTSRDLISKGFFSADEHQHLFHASTFLKAYMTKSKIDEFNALKTPIANRWTEFFINVKDKVKCEPLIRIVSYILTIPGKLELFYKYCSICNNMSAIYIFII